MTIISERNVRRAAARHARSVVSVERWIELVQSTNAANLMELRRGFGDVDQVRAALVFNIGGNNYRLICCVYWPGQTLYFRRLLTHAEYDTTTIEDLCQ